MSLTLTVNYTRPTVVSLFSCHITR